MTELKSYNLKPTFCIQIQNDQFSSYPIYKITFTPGTSVLEVRKVGIIFHSCMHWEKYDSKKPFKQYLHYQAYGQVKLQQKPQQKLLQ